jgi:hypothetical protein
MRKITYISVIAVFLLAGCDTNYWIHPTQWREKYTETTALCQGYVWTDNQLFPRCMLIHGWSQSDELLGSNLP